MLEILQNEGNLVAIKLSGKLTDADYKQFLPVIKSAAAKGPLHLLVQLENLQGWEPQALWDDIQLDQTLGSQIERLAFIGDKDWEQWMANISKPFTRAQIQSFASTDAQDAWTWVQDGLESYAN